MATSSEDETLARSGFSSGLARTQLVLKKNRCLRGNGQAYTAS